MRVGSRGLKAASAQSGGIQYTKSVLS